MQPINLNGGLHDLGLVNLSWSSQHPGLDWGLPHRSTTILSRHRDTAVGDDRNRLWRNRSDAIADRGHHPATQTRRAMASANCIRAAVVRSTDSSQGAEAAHRYWVRLMLREFRTQER
jgi:hypothetical protein